MTSDRFETTVAAELQRDPKRPRTWLIQSLVPPRDLQPRCQPGGHPGVDGARPAPPARPRPAPLSLLGRAAVDGIPALPVLPRLASAASSNPSSRRSRWNCGVERDNVRSHIYDALALAASRRVDPGRAAGRCDTPRWQQSIRFRTSPSARGGTGAR